MPYLIRTRRSRLFGLLTIGVLVLDIVASASVPLFTKYLIDELSSPNLNTVIWLTFSGFAALWWIKKISEYCEAITFFPILNDAIYHIPFRLVNHLHNIGWVDFQKLSIPKIISAIKRLSLSARFFLRTVCILFIPCCIKILTGCSLLFSFPYISYILGMSIVLFFTTLWFGLKWYLNTRVNAWKYTDQSTLSIHDSLLNTLYARFHTPFENYQVESMLKQEHDCWEKANLRYNVLHIVSQSIILIAIILSLGICIFFIQKGKLLLGDFLFIKGQLFVIFLSLRAFSNEMRHIFEATHDIQSINQLLNLPLSKATPLLYSDKQPTITLKNIHFSYSSHHPTLHHISVNINRNDCIYLQGPSGSGKTTLAHAITGLIKPQQGTITYPSGFIIHKHIHYIPQEAPLFNASLRYNITYGRDNVTTQELHEALKMIQLEEFVNSLPEKLNTPIGERGTLLSGGQRQRILLARAWLHKPWLLILDESLHAMPFLQSSEILTNLRQHIPALLIIGHQFPPSDILTQLWTIENHTLHITHTPLPNNSRLLYT